MTGSDTYSTLLSEIEVNPLHGLGASSLGAEVESAHIPQESKAPNAIKIPTAKFEAIKKLKSEKSLMGRRRTTIKKIPSKVVTVGKDETAEMYLESRKIRFRKLKGSFASKKLNETEINELTQYLIQTDPVNFLSFMSRFAGVQNEDSQKYVENLVKMVSEFDPHPNLILKSYVKEIIEKEIQSNETRKLVKTVLNLLGFDFFPEERLEGVFKQSFYTNYPKYKNFKETGQLIAAMNQNPDEFDSILAYSSQRLRSSVNGSASSLSEGAGRTINSKINKLANTDYPAAANLRSQLLGLRILSASTEYEKFVMALYGFKENENGLDTDDLAKELIRHRPKSVISILFMNRLQLQDFALTYLGSELSREPAHVKFLKQAVEDYFNANNPFYLQPPTFRKKVEDIVETVDKTIDDLYTKHNNYIVDEYYEALSQYGFFTEMVPVEKTVGYDRLRKALESGDTNKIKIELAKQYPELFYEYITMNDQDQIMISGRTALKKYRRNFNPSKITHIIERQLNKGKTESGKEIEGTEELRETLISDGIILRSGEKMDMRQLYATRGYDQKEGGLDDDKYRLVLLEKYPSFLGKIVSTSRSELDAFFGRRFTEKKKEANFERELVEALNKISQDSLYILARDFLVKYDLLYKFPIDVSLQTYKDYISQNKPFTLDMRYKLEKEALLRKSYAAHSPVSSYSPVSLIPPDSDIVNLKEEEKKKWIEKLDKFELIARRKFSETVKDIITNSSPDNLNFDFVEIRSCSQLFQSAMQLGNIDPFRPFMAYALPDKVDYVLLFDKEALQELFYEALFREGKCFKIEKPDSVMEEMRQTINRSRRTQEEKRKLFTDLARLRITA